VTTPVHPPESPDPPTERMRRSEHRREFLDWTDSTRGVDDGRALLAAEWKYVAPLLPAGTPRLLELACGPGAHALPWAERGADVTGIDFDFELLRIARDRCAAGGVATDRHRWAASDATRLPFRDACFDVINCNSLFEHVPDWRAVLREMSRVVRPGGVVIVYTSNRHCPLQNEINHFPFYPWLPEAIKGRILRWIMAHRRDLVNYTEFPAIHWFTYPGLKRAFREEGFEPFDRVDLLARAGGTGLKRRLAGAIAGVAALRPLYWVYSRAVGLYGVKRG
jgi:ubiquinone/menaquinone biosynthesis C-methylase UbiE